ncbi:hypothetical protein BC829DRAFT_445022 [Chytridium lagenaria]|nr:hypothetical protein BC829DRAFT_445022 [Chytridium lagenaria]
MPIPSPSSPSSFTTSASTAAAVEPLATLASNLTISLVYERLCGPAAVQRHQLQQKAVAEAPQSPVSPSSAVTAESFTPSPQSTLSPTSASTMGLKRRSSNTGGPALSVVTSNLGAKSHLSAAVSATESACSFRTPVSPPFSPAHTLYEKTQSQMMPFPESPKRRRTADGWAEVQIVEPTTPTPDRSPVPSTPSTPSTASTLTPTSPNPLSDNYFHAVKTRLQTYHQTHVLTRLVSAALRTRLLPSHVVTLALYHVWRLLQLSTLPNHIATPDKLLLAGLMLAEASLVDRPISTRSWAKIYGAALCPTWAVQRFAAAGVKAPWMPTPAEVAAIKMDALNALNFNIHINERVYAGWLVAIENSTKASIALEKAAAAVEAGSGTPPLSPLP